MAGSQDERSAATAVWLALAVADALPRDERFPPFLGAFTARFISEVLGEDPHGEPERIRATLVRFAESHPPDPSAVRALLARIQFCAMRAIGSERTAPANASAFDLASSPLGVKFGLKGKKR